MLPTPLVDGEGTCCPSPRTLPPLSAFGLDFRPSGLIPQSPPTVFISAPMLRGLDKTLICIAKISQSYFACVI